MSDLTVGVDPELFNAIVAALLDRTFDSLSDAWRAIERGVNGTRTVRRCETEYEQTMIGQACRALILLRDDDMPGMKPMSDERRSYCWLSIGSGVDEFQNTWHLGAACRAQMSKHRGSEATR